MTVSGADDGEQSARVPRPAAWLGGLGLLPFVALSLASGLAAGVIKATAVQALLAYGAVILSFLGGIHWGAEMTRAGLRTDRGLDATPLMISVVPSLAGWAALLLDPRYGLALLAAGFATHLVLDIKSTHRGLMPAWYPRLRKPLTTIVMAALVAAMLTN